MKNNFMISLFNKKNFLRKSAGALQKDEQNKPAKIIQLYQKNILQKQQAKIIAMFG